MLCCGAGTVDCRGERLGAGAAGSPIVTDVEVDVLERVSMRMSCVYALELKMKNKSMQVQLLAPTENLSFIMLPPAVRTSPRIHYYPCIARRRFYWL